MRTIRHMRIPTNLEPGDREGVLELISTTVQRFTAEGANSSRDTLGGIHAVVPFASKIHIPEHLWSMRDGGMDLLDPDAALFFLQRVAAAADTREKNEHLFVVPGWSYLADRESFHEMFDPIAPPVGINRTPEGTTVGTRIPRDQAPDLDQWMTYFHTRALRHELLRAIMYMKAEEIAGILRRFSADVPSPDAPARSVLIEVFGDSFLETELGRYFEAAVEMA